MQTTFKLFVSFLFCFSLTFLSGCEQKTEEELKDWQINLENSPFYFENEKVKKTAIAQYMKLECMSNFIYHPTILRDVKYLISKGADPNAWVFAYNDDNSVVKGKDGKALGMTPIYAAFLLKDNDTLEILLQNGAIPTETDWKQINNPNSFSHRMAVRHSGPHIHLERGYSKEDLIKTLEKYGHKFE